MEQKKEQFSRMIFFCTALLILNAVVPQRLYILPACCTAQESSCCKKASSGTNPVIRNRSCCEVKVIELRQSLSTQIIAQRNCPEILSIDIYNSVPARCLINESQPNARPTNTIDNVVILRSNENYPEPRIQI